MPQHDVNRWLVAAGIAAGSWLVGWLTVRLVLPRMAALAGRSRTSLDDAVLGALRPHLPLWLLVLGGVLAARQVTPDAEALRIVGRVAQIALILSGSLALAAFLNHVLERAPARWSGPFQSTSLIQNSVRIVVIGLGALMVVSTLGITITPVLTALGVGSLAVALALQPTLANLFAGFHITLAGQVRVGDFVELETGQQGYVTDIGWRSTQIRELPNNVVVVPNARLAEILVRNFALPEPEQAALVNLGVSYGSDLERVETITIEVARQVQREVAGAEPGFEPFIRYNAFGDSAIAFTVILRVKTFVDRYPVIHEFIKRLKARYDREGIEIPFPQRVLRGTVAAALVPAGDGQAAEVGSPAAGTGGRS